MTAPNMGDPEDMPDAVNAGSGISGAASTSATDHMQGRFDQIGGPLGSVAGWLLGGLAGKVIADAEDSVKSSPSGSYTSAAGKTFGHITDMKSQTESPVVQLAKAVFGGWFGGGAGAVGTPQEVQYTIESIKQAIIAGYTVDTIVVSGSYVVPDCAELGVIAIGGGRDGQDGGDKRIAKGGDGGGYGSTMLDHVALAGRTLSVTVGSSGLPSTVRDDVGSLLFSVGPGAVGGIANGVWGYSPTTSTPGRGGDGGYGGYDGGSASAGDSGQGSAIAGGGAGGSIGNPGTAGANSSVAASTKSGGGGGGGGGGGANTARSNGGSGGPGGYPGGGGAGGGGRGGSVVLPGSHGAGGIGAPGVMWFVWK